MSTTYPSDLSDAEWACVQRYLPPLPRRGRPRTHLLRRVLDAIFYLVRTGCPWRYLPANFPPWQTVFYHFRRFRLTLVARFRKVLPGVIYDMVCAKRAHKVQLASVIHCGHLGPV